jgi:superfamily II DNA or RNA helicase
MHAKKKTVPHHIDIICDYDRLLYKSIWKDRWDPYDNKPIEETGKLFYLLRRVANGDKTRLEALRELLETHRRCIIFYNFSYELHAIRSLLNELDICTGEWNGELHTDVPDGDRWAYLVQYTAGAEGWNCIGTDTIIFYSQSYSYRQTKQAEGRIDRANTPYIDLYYYRLKSKAPIDIAIERALRDKHNFNENKYLNRSCNQKT